MGGNPYGVILRVIRTSPAIVETAILEEPNRCMIMLLTDSFGPCRLDDISAKGHMKMTDRLFVKPAMSAVDQVDRKV